MGTVPAVPDEAPVNDVRILQDRISALRDVRTLQALKEIDGYFSSRYEAVRVAARDARLWLIADWQLFGQGLLPRLDLPPRMETAEERARGHRWIWITWLVCGFIAVNALIIRSHTDSATLPFLGATLATLAMLYVSLRLRKSLPSPGWVLLDRHRREMLLESSSDPGSIRQEILPFSRIVSLRKSHVAVLGTPSDEQDVAYELEVCLEGGRTVSVARRPHREDLDLLADHFRSHLQPLPPNAAASPLDPPVNLPAVNPSP